MKTRSLLRFICFSLIVAGTEIRAEDPQAYGTEAGNLVVPDGLRERRVQECIVRAAMGREWKILVRDDEKVVVVIEDGRLIARVAMLFTNKEVRFFSNSTKGGKPTVPSRWINNLKEDIAENLSASRLRK